MESWAPARWPRHVRTPTATSAAHMTTNPICSGALSGIPTAVNGPSPWVGKPRNVHTEP